MREKWSAAPRRIAAFDALRGFALVNMAVYHGVYDWVYVFGRPAAWFTQTGNAHIWQQFICWTFILLAGAVFPYGKHAVRRGAVTFGCGFLLTAVTMLVMPSEQITVRRSALDWGGRAAQRAAAPLFGPRASAARRHSFLCIVFVPAKRPDGISGHWRAAAV